MKTPESILSHDLLLKKVICLSWLVILHRQMFPDCLDNRTDEVSFWFCFVDEWTRSPRQKEGIEVLPRTASKNLGAEALHDPGDDQAPTQYCGRTMWLIATRWPRVWGKQMNRRRRCLVFPHFSSSFSSEQAGTPDIWRERQNSHRMRFWFDTDAISSITSLVFS